MRYGKCFLCGKWAMLEKHHIFGNSNRKKSEEYGLVVELCRFECHREGEKAVHRCKETMDSLHQYGQKKYMREHNASVEDFIQKFGKNYI